MRNGNDGQDSQDFCFNKFTYYYSTVPISSQSTPPSSLLSAQPSSAMMHLFFEMLTLSVLGVGEVGRVPLTPARNPIPDVAPILSSVTVAVTSNHMTLDAAVIMAISTGSALFMPPMSAPLAVPLVYPK